MTERAVPFVSIISTLRLDILPPPERFAPPILHPFGKGSRVFIFLFRGEPVGATRGRPPGAGDGDRVGGRAGRPEDDDSRHGEKGQGVERRHRYTALCYERRCKKSSLEYYVKQHIVRK